jgi:hypothetical protein
MFSDTFNLYSPLKAREYAPKLEKLLLCVSRYSAFWKMRRVITVFEMSNKKHLQNLLPLTSSLALFLFLTFWNLSPGPVEYNEIPQAV